MTLGFLYFLLALGFGIWLLIEIITTKKEVRKLQKLLNMHMSELKKSVQEK